MAVYAVVLMRGAKIERIEMGKGERLAIGKLGLVRAGFWL
jgi:hypothetical protein